MPKEDPIARLARQIEGDARTNRQFLLKAEEVARLRRLAAAQLHSICAEFVVQLNAQLSQSALELSPRDYTAESFREAGVNLFQISGNGRILQIAFQATRDLSSTEKFLIPYILDGEIRTFNQQMLDRLAIRSQGLFYCVEEDQNSWRFSDWFHNSTGIFDRTVLAGLVEQLF